MATLIIKRKSEWINWLRRIGIYLDDTKIGVIANGETIQFNIQPGTHRLKGKMDWCGSSEYTFTSSGEETHTVVIGSFKYSTIIIGLEVLILLAHIIARKFYGINYIFWFALPFFLVNLFYVTIGHNKYLTLSEDQLSLSF